MLSGWTQATTELITPERAKELLGNAGPNRTPRTRKVELYARMMREGRWFTGVGEAIALDANGRLRNGVHRLLAVIEADIPVELPVVYGITEDAVAVIDTGVARRFSDVLKMRGEVNASGLASALRFLAHYRLGEPMGSRSVDTPPTDLLALLEAEPNLRDFIALGRGLRVGASFGSEGMGAALTYLADEVDPEEAHAFYCGVVGGKITGNDMPLILRNTLVRIANTSGASRGPDPTYRAALYIKAFNYWRLGRELQTLRWIRGGKTREDFPRFLSAEELASGMA